ncbi:MAG: hypothetical protein IKP92_08730 [Lachnospiraceae bacterium]|nr:hypothetical protein [Lachnospiraceae bacterium]
MDNRQIPNEEIPKKRFKDKIHLNFFVLLFVIAPIFAYTVYLVFKRPDVVHLFWLIMASAVLVLDIFWMQEKFFEDRNALNKKINEWDNRRRAMRARNLPFHEPKPQKQKILTPVIPVLFAIVFGIYIFSFLPLKLIDAAVPKTRLFYKIDISSLKEKNPNKYGFLPDEVPKNATGVKWTVFPTIMQGDGYELLTFYADSSYLENEINTKCAGIEPQSMMNMPVLNFMTPAQAQSAEWYPMFDLGDNHRTTWGIAVDKNSGLIAYFVQ